MPAASNAQIASMIVSAGLPLVGVCGIRVRDGRQRWANDSACSTVKTCSKVRYKPK